MIVEVCIEAFQFPLEGGEQSFDGFARLLGRDHARTVLLSRDHLHDLATTRDKLAQLLGLGIRQRPDLRLGGLNKGSDQIGIDHIGLGLLAHRIGIGSHLRRINDDHRKSGGCETGCR